MRMFIALSIIAKRYKHPKCPSADEWIYKRWSVCPDNGILFSHKTEWDSDTCYNVDEP